MTSQLQVLLSCLPHVHVTRSGLFTEILASELIIVIIIWIVVVRIQAKNYVNYVNLIVLVSKGCMVKSQMTLLTQL
ncbi:hypothetical protein EB796_015122 [Bugula neritina]|uniref:Uncharacterized protein n=1 Tax=Bugula neritina TaxID=10212 RepID=A0A7J7JJU5_BUGNE|nr:hypothetical protein EB796_015122 [Bugula neritina]